MTFNAVFSIKQIWFLSPLLQIFLVCTLFILTAIIQFREYKKKGKVWEYYPVNNFLLFVPIYEEIFFRGFIFVGLMTMYSILTSVIISSILFGLWHLKNIFWLPKQKLTAQMLYSGLVFGPIMALVTLTTGTIWVAVILHYLNNLFAPISLRKVVLHN